MYVQSMGVYIHKYVLYVCMQWAGDVHTYVRMHSGASMTNHSECNLQFVRSQRFPENFFKYSLMW